MCVNVLGAYIYKNLQKIALLVNSGLFVSIGIIIYPACNTTNNKICKKLFIMSNIILQPKS